jgi:hypothetical protein
VDTWALDTGRWIPVAGLLPMRDIDARIMIRSGQLQFTFDELATTTEHNAIKRFDSSADESAERVRWSEWDATVARPRKGKTPNLDPLFSCTVYSAATCPLGQWPLGQ